MKEKIQKKRGRKPMLGSNPQGPVAPIKSMQEAILDKKAETKASEVAKKVKAAAPWKLSNKGHKAVAKSDMKKLSLNPLPVNATFNTKLIRIEDNKIFSSAVISIKMTIPSAHGSVVIDTPEFKIPLSLIDNFKVDNGTVNKAYIDGLLKK